LTVRSKPAHEQPTPAHRPHPARRQSSPRDRSSPSSFSSSSCCSPAPRQGSLQAGRSPRRPAGCGDPPVVPSRDARADDAIGLVADAPLRRTFVARPGAARRCDVTRHRRPRRTACARRPSARATHPDASGRGNPKPEALGCLYGLASPEESEAPGESALVGRCASQARRHGLGATFGSGPPPGDLRGRSGGQTTSVPTPPRRSPWTAPTSS
jgi:hypothetical protein